MIHPSRFFLLSLAALNGCSTYSETFDCPPGNGVGCKSLSDVNQLVEEGKLPLKELPVQEDAEREDLTQPLAFDTHIKVWVAGYEDAQGNSHLPAYVYASLEKESQEAQLLGETPQKMRFHKQEQVKD